jgi:hypothetical protein
MVCIEKDEGKLVTAKSRDQIAGAHDGLQLARRISQHGVAGIVADRVVDGFEAVEIDGENGNRSAVADLLEALRQACPGRLSSRRAASDRATGTVLEVGALVLPVCGLANYSPAPSVPPHGAAQRDFPPAH